MQMIAMPTLWTIGHGNREEGEFLDLLQENAIRILVDIRSRPVSTRHPWFNEDRLRVALQERSIAYHWAGKALGGLRRPLPNSRHRALADAPAAQGFADHMAGDFFRRAAVQLMTLARQGRTVLLCAEMDYRQCHRRLLADYLCLAGCEVEHILGKGERCSHLLSAELRRESAELVYDRLSSHTLDF